jgi:hypothetical protein
MCPIEIYVNHQRHHRGRPPKYNRALQAFIGAHLLRERALGIDSITKAAIASGTTRAAVSAALTILHTEDVTLAASVLAGRESLFRAASRVRGRVKLIETFRAATAADRVALGRVIGATQLFDAAIAPAL